MRCPLRVPWLAAASGLLFSALRAQSLLPPEPVRLDSLAAFKSPAANWQLAGGLGGDPRHDKTLTPTAGSGILVDNPRPDAKGHLFTAWEHGDLELDLDFLIPPGSNSGVYLQSRYEVQIYDSWGKKDVTSLDCGSIYERWDDAREKGKQGYDGHAPKANACRAPGLWQHLHVEFEAPRFDATGKKTKNARFLKVVLNDFVVQENVEVTGPTRSAADEKTEVPLAPLMIQGDHGPVAIRALAIKRAGVEAITVSDLHYKLYPGEYKKAGEYDAEKPQGEGALTTFAHTAIEKRGKFGLVFTGAVTVPRAGTYAFAIDSSGFARLLIDDHPVVVPLERGSGAGTIELAAGAHAFRLDLVQTSNGRPTLELMAEGPGIAKQTLTVREREERRAFTHTPMLIDVKDRVVAQRSFVPYEPRKRLYAINVGTPSGVSFAYDFETGALLRVWRGAFLDTYDMWNGRGEPQLGRPAGPALTLNAKPSVALIEYATTGDWPNEAEALWSSQGYTLQPDGTPVFLSRLSKTDLRDTFTPTADGRGLTRTLVATGELTAWSTWFLLAEASKITREPDGSGWIIGDREWYLDWPADAAVSPVVRTRNGHQQLAVPITKGTLDTPIRYTLVW